MMGLLAIPLIGFVGVAVDYTKASANKFFLLKSSTDVVTTFNQIGTALSNLRLAM